MSINLTKNTIDLSKTYQTRDGLPVTLLHRRPDGWPSDYPYAGLVNGVASIWLANGQVTKEKLHNGDLIEVREPREFEVVVSTRENTRFNVSEIDGKATDDLANGDRNIPAGWWEIIRVREILDEPTP